jgi:hypothetical protein
MTTTPHEMQRYGRLKTGAASRKAAWSSCGSDLCGSRATGLRLEAGLPACDRCTPPGTGRAQAGGHRPPAGARLRLSPKP